jgi:hypothetical protein
MLKSMGGLYPHRARDLIVSGTVLVAHALVACNGDSIDLTGPCCDAEAAANFNFQLDATNRVQFRLIGVNGRMLVTGASAGEQFIVRGERRVESSSQADAEARLNDLQVEITESANEIVIRTVQPTNTGGRNFIVDYELLVPDRLVANITNVNGEITVDDFDSGAFVTNVNGLVIVRDIEGDTAVSLVNGNIDAELRIEDDGSIDLVNVNGTIDLDIPVDTDAQLSATLANGTITVLNLAVQNQVSSPTSLTGTLGDGDGTIRLESTNGSIMITGV